MKKSSNLFEHFRELVAAANQCDLNKMNGLPSFQTEHHYSVGFGEQVSSLYETDMMHFMLDVAKVS